MENADIFKLRDEWYEEAKKQTRDTLLAFFDKLAAHPHDYSTICYACAAVASAAARAMDRTPNGGITGFQGGAVMWEFMDTWNGIKGPARLLDYNDLLFPQMEHKFRNVSAEAWEAIQEKAKSHLAEDHTHAHPDVVAHWKSVANGKIPFGLAIGE